MANDNTLFFIKELAFEQTLANLLHTSHGWDGGIMMNPTEEDLVQNWANILYDINRDINRLGNAPLTQTEMQQVIDQVNMCASPFEVNRLINGGQIIIKRDNPADTNNCGKEIYLKIFDAQEICAGQSRYQIVRQPRFKASHPLGGDRRGDVMLLINGMPVIHVELKRSGVDVTQAVFQIKRYTHEGVFSSGIFKLVQIFVAMTPEKTLYFANPGAEDNFKPEFQFHWADFNNVEVTDWRTIASQLLSIPMAHQLVGYYTIADEKDKTLKVLRSYQYYAASKISDVTHRTNWDTHQHRGGYIWHTTGSGKTMASFKSAQLIANSGDADKVVFLLDRIELSIQSLDEYRGFAGDDDSIQDTQNTAILVSKLKSTDPDDRLIVTSIQKMSNINVQNGIAQSEIDAIGRKRLVFIIDECHRSVFGGMLIGIKNAFPRALLFGFTGTPVFEENAHNEITTETLFGDMLHKYTIASGIPDGNVLGFDVYRVNTYEDDELREKAAFAQLEVHTIEEVEEDEEKKKVYNKFISELQMPDTYNDPKTGKLTHGIEHYLPKDIYQQRVHHLAVAQDIMAHREQASKNGKFHAILATQNIPEAIAYYKLFKEIYPSVNAVTVFDNNIDNSDGGIAKEDAILEMLTDYNAHYQTTFALATYGKYKKDVAKRLAHKKPYLGIEHDHTQQIDLLIVVTQMLTGYDSKWVNTLYVDKVMKYVDIIQSFSRTNRLFGPDKPFGIIKYYTFPYTMEQNIEDALEVYVDRPLGVFVDKLEQNLDSINRYFLHISDIFKSHNIQNFSKLPDTREDRNMFAKDFVQMTRLLEAAKLQGFLWEKTEYEFEHGDTYTKVKMEFDEATYLTLLQRYRELFESKPGGGSEPTEFDYPIDTYITETGTGTIDAEYINSKFVKFVKNLYMNGTGSELTKDALKELHKTFASLSQRDQRTAMVILHDIESGDLHLEAGKTIQDYIAEYQLRELHKQILILAEATGLNSSQLAHIMGRDVTEQNINEYNQFENLKLTLDGVKTRAFLEKVEGTTIPPRMVRPKADKILRDFILDGAKREAILKAYLGVNEDAQSETETTPEEVATAVRQTSEAETGFNLELVRDKLEAVLTSCIPSLLIHMRPKEEIVNSVFYVINTKSIDSLDGVDIFIQRAFENLYTKKTTLVDKHIAFNQLVTKFEAYLKKLYYLINDKELPARNEGDTPSWKDAIYAHKCLWNLRWSTDEAKQQLYHWLLLVKGWRNEESHISPTASEQEVDAALNIILTMYFYVTGSSITALEISGHDISATDITAETTSKIVDFTPYYMNSESRMVAEPEDIRNLPEETRIDILKKSIIQLLGYIPKKSPFTKQRHWIAIYRIVADMGFIIDGDYAYFKSIIDNMKIETLNVPLTTAYLEKTVKGLYATNIEDWTNEGVSSKELAEYEDIKSCADAFSKIVEKNIPKKEES